MPEQDFQFEHTVDVAEADYAALQQVAPVSRRTRVLLLGLGVLGVALAFTSRWTAPVGGILVLAALVFWFTPRIGRRGVHEGYRHARYLHGPVTYGVGHRGLWFSGGALRAESAWSGLAVWERRGDSLLLSADGMPQVVLPIAALQAAGVVEQVLELARRHGVEFNSPQSYGRGPLQQQQPNESLQLTGADGTGS